ncbi:hypothetical protein N0V83_007368 [Neocucurbitaria cava]|uniref:Uncharacterized protein n=1 Tax=Neocucurbitaria cava TaxID=798079 RepID=A0A9W8Y3H9_9PLEO|nr:hypothetical protein N0V83_007368 [Neocucurbitaria cava]
MFVFSVWLRKRREERQLIKEIEAREAERRIQQEKQDNEIEAREAEMGIQREKRNDQQAQALLLTLYELQRTMDPLIAAQVYNIRFCPLISRLPEELLMCQQGSVQLCEHIQITWASIKAHIDGWRQQQRGGGDWQACFDSFNIECHDASHDTRCTASEAPTWPRARLGTGTFDSSIVVLNLEWEPHSRIDALALTADGRMPAPELRALFQRLRTLEPADTLCPPCRPGALPEMAFFSPYSRTGRFVYYKTGGLYEIGPPRTPLSPLPPYSLLVWHDYHGRGKNGKKLDIRPHYPTDAGGTGISSQCLVVSYEKDVMICKTTAMTDSAVKIIPTDHWLHAMDTQTYPHPQASHIRPQCRNVTCRNYYRTRKDEHACPAWTSADDVYR